MNAILNVLKVFSLGYPGVEKKVYIVQDHRYDYLLLSNVFIEFSENSWHCIFTTLLLFPMYFNSSESRYDTSLVTGKKHVKSGSFNVSVIVISRTFNYGNLQGLFLGSLVQFVGFDSMATKVNARRDHSEMTNLQFVSAFILFYLQVPGIRDNRESNLQLLFYFCFLLVLIIFLTSFVFAVPLKCTLSF